MITFLLTNSVLLLLLFTITLFTVKRRIKVIKAYNHDECPNCSYLWNHSKSNCCSECGFSKCEQAKAAPLLSTSKKIIVTIPLVFPVILLVSLAYIGIADSIRGVAIEWQLWNWVNALVVVTLLFAAKYNIVINAMITRESAIEIGMLQLIIDYLILSILLSLVLVDFI